MFDTILCVRKIRVNRFDDILKGLSHSNFVYSESDYISSDCNHPGVNR